MSTELELPSLLTTGSSIPKELLAIASPDEEEVQLPESAYEDPDLDEAEWSEKPTYAAQLSEHPDTCRILAQQVALFDLLKPEELKGYNHIQSLAEPQEAPTLIIIEDTVKDPADGKWLALLRYRRLSYKKLIRKQP
jgi:hypothetical protein